MTDIAEERRRLAGEGLRIIRRETWGARQNYTSDRACDVPAAAFFLHISVTELDDDEHADMREIERIGQARFGIGCSYNAASFPSGNLYEAQPLTRRGAHTVNNFERATCPTHGGSLRAPSWNNNVNARALVLPQMVDDPVTDAQVDAAARWAAAQVRAGLAVRGVRWHGHRCVSAKDCPGQDGYSRIPHLQRLTDHYVAAGLQPPDLLEELMATPQERADLIADIAAAVAQTPQPLFPYVKELYADADGKMSLSDAAQHAAAQALAANRAANSAKAEAAAAKAETVAVMQQLAELRVLVEALTPPAP